nr:hypothetical protein [Streptomyces sp. TSRI0281]
MDWVERTAQLRQWTRSGARAPHKPLLFLYALSRFQQAADDELRYSAVEEDLRGLLVAYGPGNRTTPAYPFHHLVSDGVWEVRTERGPGSPGTGVGELRSSGAAGRLAPELRAALRREPSRHDRLTADPGSDGRPRFSWTTSVRGSRTGRRPTSPRRCPVSLYAKVWKTLRELEHVDHSLGSAAQGGVCGHALGPWMAASWSASRPRAMRTCARLPGRTQARSLRTGAVGPVRGTRLRGRS